MRPAPPTALSATPIVSVVIPCFNHGRYLEEAVDSVLAQSYGNVEVIVVDDGSTDDTPAVAARFGSRIIYIRQPNGGPPVAKNRGVARSSGELIALLDADDRWLPEKLALQVARFRGDPRVGVVHSAYAVIGEDGRRSGVIHEPPEHCSFHDLIAGNRLGNLTAVISRAAFDKVGLFDPELPGVEDWDLWIRLADRYAIVGLPDVLAEYRQHGANISGDPHRMIRRQFAVLAKRRLDHGDCAECSASIRNARSSIRADYARQLRAMSAAAASHGRHGRALWLNLVAALRGRSISGR